jgi:oligoribonuclease NrnB/cAMP/cGMP phosphodiesterase (DHH superfamily)
MKCFYHKSDLDGHCSGAIIKERYPECEMIGVDYNDKLDLEAIKPGEPVFVVDFCFSTGEMVQLEGKAMLCWIDHHKSSIDKMAELSLDIAGFREIGQAGCELTWKWLNPDTIMPLPVYFLGRYDVWAHEEDEDILIFQQGMKAEKDTLPGAPIWKALFAIDTPEDALLDDILRTGHIILDYQNKQNAEYAANMAYEAEFHGLRAIVLNKPYSNSQAFDSVYDPAKHDIMVTFGVKPKEYRYSMYATKENVDVSEIAKKYGGGGHKGAAGFFSETQII